MTKQKRDVETRTLETGRGLIKVWAHGKTTVAKQGDYLSLSSTALRLKTAADLRTCAADLGAIADAMEAEGNHDEA